MATFETVLLHGPRNEELALARAIVAEPHAQPVHDDALLQLAARQVQSELSTYDHEQIRRAQAEPGNLALREMLERALAYRILRAYRRLRGQLGPTGPGGD